MTANRALHHFGSAAARAPGHHQICLQMLEQVWQWWGCGGGKSGRERGGMGLGGCGRRLIWQQWHTQDPTLPFCSFPLFSPWTCTSYRAGTGPRRFTEQEGLQKCQRIEISFPIPNLPIPLPRTQWVPFLVQRQSHSWFAVRLGWHNISASPRLATLPYVSQGHTALHPKLLRLEASWAQGWAGSQKAPMFFHMAAPCWNQHLVVLASPCGTLLMSLRRCTSEEREDRLGLHGSQW